jgi:hypothetical protein
MKKIDILIEEIEKQQQIEKTKFKIMEEINKEQKRKNTKKIVLEQIEDLEPKKIDSAEKKETKNYLTKEEILLCFFLQINHK